MKIYRSKKEAGKDVVNGSLIINDDVTFDFSLSCNWNIKAFNINVFNIKAWDIEADNIDSWDICAWDLLTRNLDAHEIRAHKIDSYDIRAIDIVAHEIKANDIEFHAYAIAFNTFKCRSIVGERENAKYICLDSEVIITGEIK